MIHESLLDDCNLDHAHKARIEGFTASKGWLKRFAKWHLFQNVKLSGEAGIVNTVAVVQDMVNLCKRLELYALWCIFNKDFLGLIWKLLLYRIYISKNENKQVFCGTKAIRANDGITGYVCTNSAEVMVPMFIIGNLKMPRCFRFEEPPVPCSVNLMRGQIQQILKHGSLLYSFHLYAATFHGLLH